MTEQQFDNIEDYIADLKAKLAVNRECGNTLYNLGVAYLSKRDFMEAERCFREAVANSPSWPRPTCSSAASPCSAAI